MNLAISPLKKFIFYYYSVMLKIKTKDFEGKKRAYYASYIKINHEIQCIPYCCSN